jgi:hypothetical protein
MEGRDLSPVQGSKVGVNRTGSSFNPASSVPIQLGVPPVLLALL